MRITSESLEFLSLIFQRFCMKYVDVDYFLCRLRVLHTCILTQCTELAIPLHVLCIIFRADRQMEILYFTQIRQLAQIDAQKRCILHTNTYFPCIYLGLVSVSINSSTPYL